MFRNWKRGFLRTWAVTSVGWLIYAMWQSATSQYDDLILEFGSQKNRTWLYVERVFETLGQPDQYIWLFGPPMVALVVGALIFWAAIGFQKTA